VGEETSKALSLALMTTGREANASAGHFRDYANELQNQTRFGNDAIKSAEALLIQLTDLDTKGLDAATRGTIGLAQVFKVDLESAARMVAKGMEGNFMALQRMIPALKGAKTESEKLAIMNRELAKYFEVAKGSVDSFAGRLDQLKNSWNDVQKEIGNAVINNKEWNTLLAACTKLMRDFTDPAAQSSKIMKLWALAVNIAADQLIEHFGPALVLVSKDMDDAKKKYMEGGIPLATLTGLYDKLAKAFPVVGSAGKEMWELWVKYLTPVKHHKELTEELLKLYEDLRTRGMTPMQKETRDIIKNMEAVNQAMKDGSIDAKQYRDWMNRLQRQLWDLNKGFEEFGTNTIPQVGKRAQTMRFVWLEQTKGMAVAWTDWCRTFDSKFYASLGLAIMRLRGFGGDTKKTWAQMHQDFFETMNKIQEGWALMSNQLDAISAQSQKNQEIKLDNQYKVRLDYIKNTIKDETKQREAITALDAEYDIKRRSLQHSAAVQQKAMAIVQAIINTAEGVTKALAQGGIFGGILGAVVAALGAIQIRLIMAQPIPLKAGAIFTQPTRLLSERGQSYEVGEGGEPEVLAPLSRLGAVARAAGAAIGAGNVFYFTVPVYIGPEKVDEQIWKIVQRGGELRKFRLPGKVMTQ
jgi:hypothetical protein